MLHRNIEDVAGFVWSESDLHHLVELAVLAQLLDTQSILGLAAPVLVLVDLQQGGRLNTGHSMGLLGRGRFGSSSCAAFPLGGHGTLLQE